LREAKVSIQAKIKLYEDHAKDCVEVAERTDNPVHREILLKDGPRLDEGRGRAASGEAVVAAGRGKIAEELDTIRLCLSGMSKDLREGAVQGALVGSQ
jgi:hypothetical protein